MAVEAVAERYGMQPSPAKFWARAIRPLVVSPTDLKSGNGLEAEGKKEVSKKFIVYFDNGEERSTALGAPGAGSVCNLAAGWYAK